MLAVPQMKIEAFIFLLLPYYGLGPVVWDVTQIDFTWFSWEKLWWMCHKIPIHMNILQHSHSIVRTACDYELASWEFCTIILKIHVISHNTLKMSRETHTSMLRHCTKSSQFAPHYHDFWFCSILLFAWRLVHYICAHNIFWLMAVFLSWDRFVLLFWIFIAGVSTMCSCHCEI